MFSDVRDRRLTALLVFEGSTQCELKKRPNLLENRRSLTKKATQTTFHAWTDDEVELFLNVTMDYKASKTMESIDWDWSKGDCDRDHIAV